MTESLMSIVSLRSISSFREWEYASVGDWDFGQADLAGFLVEDYAIDSISQEFNLTGSLDVAAGVEYVLGAFYAKETMDYIRQASEGTDANANWGTVWGAALGAMLLDEDNPAAGSVLDFLGAQYGGIANIPWATAGELITDDLWDYKDEVFAVFGHTTLALSDEFSLVLGLRYSEEEKTVSRRNQLFDDHEDYKNFIFTHAVGFSALGVNLSGPAFDEAIKEEELTYNIALQYFLDDSTQLYGGYARGFKAGGIDMASGVGGRNPAILAEDGSGLSPANASTYAPEYVDAYELGLKTEYQDGRGRLNVALFRSEFEDIQFSVFTGTGFIIANAGTAVSQGLELENTYLLTENLSTTVALTYLDASYGDDIPPPGTPGEDLNHAPDLAGTISLNYDREMTDDLAVFANANYNARGSHIVAYGSEHQQDGYDLVSLQLGLRDASDRWSFTLWCDNCADEEYMTFTFNQPFHFDNSNFAYPGEPRTFGATFRANF